MALLTELQIKVSPGQLSNITPSENSLRKSLNHAAAETLVVIRQKTNGNPTFLSMDGANKKGLHHMVKVISF